MTPWSPVFGRPLHVLTHTSAVRNLEIRQAQADTLLKRLGRSPVWFGYAPGWLARLRCPPDWHGSAAPRAGSVPLPGRFAWLLQTKWCFCPASLLAASARLPGWLAWLHQPTSWLSPASRLVLQAQQAGCLSRLRWHTGLLGSAARLAGTAPLPGWLIRQGYPLVTCCSCISSTLLHCNIQF